MSSLELEDELVELDLEVEEVEEAVVVAEVSGAVVEVTKVLAVALWTKLPVTEDGLTVEAEAVNQCKKPLTLAVEVALGTAEEAEAEEEAELSSSKMDHKFLNWLIKLERKPLEAPEEAAAVVLAAATLGAAVVVD